MESFFSFIRLFRPTDWIKNIFLFAPLFFTPRLFHFPQIMHVLIGSILFCIVASSIYILNDLKDAAADRLHPIKKNRLIASNKVSIQLGRFACIFLAVVGLVGSAFLSHDFFTVVIIYYLINIAYCYALKNIAIIDVYCIAAGFILRVIAGAILIQVTPTVWILICTGLLALFLALAKRRDDLVHHINEAHRNSISGYTVFFIDMSIVITLSTLFIAYTIYTTQNLPEINLGTAHFFWTVPFVLLGILRYLQVTLVEKKSGSPTALLISDTFLVSVVIIWIIFSAILIY